MFATSRRRFLAWGAGSALLLGVGGVLAWRTVGYRLADGEVALGLSRKAFCVARAVVNTLCPPSDGVPGGVELGLAQRVDEEAWSADAPTREDLEAALQLLEHLPPWFGFPGRFTSLSPERREACFQAYLRSDQDLIARAAASLKQMVHFFLYSASPTWGAIGYDGPWVAAERPPASAVAYRARVDAALGKVR